MATGIRERFVRPSSTTRQPFDVARYRVRAFVGVLVAVALTFYSPLLGVVLVVGLLGAGVYMFGRSEIAAVATYIMMLYIVSPRLALSVYEVTPAMLIGLGCMGLWLSGRATRDELRVGSPMSKVIGVYITIVVLTYGLGLTQPLLGDAVRGADRNLVKLLSLVGVALLMIDVIKTRKNLDTVVGLIVIGGSFMTGAALFQGLFGFDIVDQFQLPGFQDRGIKQTGLQLRLGLRRATGTARHPIELGTASAMVLPLALHLMAYGRSARVRLAATAGAGVAVLAMILSLSRSAYVGLVVALIMLIPRWTSQRRFRFLLSLAPVLVAVVFLAPAATEAAIDLASNWSGDEIEGARVSARTEDYEIIRELVNQKPWFGQGFGTFVGTGTFAADNQYLLSLIETGIIGVASLIGMMMMAYSLARRSYRAATTDRDRDLAASVAASVVGGILAFGVFDAMAFDLSVGSVFLTFGLSAGLHHILTNDQLSERRTRSRAAETEAADPEADQSDADKTAADQADADETAADDPSPVGSGTPPSTTDDG